jgi:hypothetical protein
VRSRSVKKRFEIARQTRLHPAELVLDSENAIGEKSSHTLCGSMRKRPDGFVSSMQSSLIVNGIRRLQDTFPHRSGFPINFPSN